MRMQFTMVIKGQETLEKKFEEALASNPGLHMDMIRSFGQTIMLALRLQQADGITIESFRAGKIPDEPVAPLVEEEKKVVN